MARKSLLHGAAILGIAGIIIKALGACFRIPLGNLIGADGMAYYQAAYPIYVIFLTIATAGIPVAISRMVSERNAVGNYYGAHRVFKVSFILLFIIGITSFSICFFGADTIAQLIKAPGAEVPMRAIAIALLFVPLMASYRGYFQGQQDMTPTAISQVIEQFFRVIAGLVLAYMFLKYGLEYAAGGAAFGATAGAIGGLITIIIIYSLRKGSMKENIAHSIGKEQEKTASILAKIFMIAIPITIGASIMPIMNFIDTGIVMGRLQATGWTYSEARELYGQLAGFSGSLINFPQVLTQAIAMTLVPLIAEDYKLKKINDLRENVHTGLRMAIVVGMPCALGLMVLAEPIMLLLFPLQKASAVGAAQCLFIMAFGVIFLSSIQTLTGVLQGIGKQMIPVRNMFIGAIAKVVITYWLTGIPAINAKGAAMGTVAAYIIASILNVMSVKKYTGTKFNLTLIYVKPTISAIVMAAVAFGIHRMFYGFIGNAFSTIIAIVIAGTVYAIMLFATKAITREEILRLPKGHKLVKIVDKFIK